MEKLFNFNQPDPYCEKECSTCGKIFNSKIPERGLQFCSEICEDNYLKDFMEREFKAAQERVANGRTLPPEKRQTTY